MTETISSALRCCRLRSLNPGRRKLGGRQSDINPPQTLNYGASRLGTLRLTGALLLLGSHMDQTEEQLQATKLLADLAGGVAPVTDVERLGLSVTTVPSCFHSGWLVVPNFLKSWEFGK